MCPVENRNLVEGKTDSGLETERKRKFKGC